MFKCRGESNVDITNEEVKGIGSEVEDIKTIKYIGKRHADIINKEMKGSSSEEEDIEIRKCRRRS